MESIRSEAWLNDFRTIILNYMEHRTSDPFMEWFCQREKAGVFKDDFEKILATIIAARFDQRTKAELAFRNTQTVIACGALKTAVSRENLPLLISKRQMNAEKWTQLFCDAQPRLHALSRKILEKKVWKADDLLYLFSDKQWKVPYLGDKTLRLAVRWLHEQIPAITIDMRSYKIPIDSLVYRVACRLGIIDPYQDVYFGNDSPADIKIQNFVKELFPETPWIMDEPLWSVGRDSSKGGHCYPSNPNCYGCMFEKLCAKKFRDIIPKDIGTKSVPNSIAKSVCGYHEKKTATEHQVAFANFIAELNRKGVTGDQFREQRDQWQREHRKTLDED